MAAAVVVIVSIVLQLATAVLALRLIRTTGMRIAWWLVASAVTLMAVERGLALATLWSSYGLHPPDVAAQGVGLIVSALLLGGVAGIGPLFQAARRSETAATERRRAEESLRHRADFETLISVISTNFINLKSDEIDAEVNRTLAKLGKFVGADRSYVFLFSGDGTRMTNTHEWCAPGVEPQAHRIQEAPTDGFPWLMGFLRRHEPMCVPRVSDLPVEAAAERREFEAQSIRSLTCIPMVCAGALMGFVGFDSVRDERAWASDFVATFRIAGEILANALERKRADEALRASLQASADIVQAIPSGLFIYQYEPPDRLVLVSANPAAERQTGCRGDEWRGREFDELWPAARQSGISQAFLRAMETGVPYEAEVLHYRDDRVEGTFAVRAFRIPGDRLGVAFENVSERRRVEAERARLATAVEEAGESILITDAEGTIQYVNPAFERITGYSRAEAVGRNPRILKSGKHKESFYRDLRDTLQRGHVWSGRFINRRKDGTLFEAEGTIAPIRDASGAIISYVSVMHDVTQEVAMEEQLRQAQKMEAIGLLAGGVAHDFNNILTAVLGNVELIRNRPNDAVRSRDGLEQIEKCAHRAAALTRQLLTFSRRQVIKPEVASLNRILTDTEELLRRLIGDEIALVCRPASDLGRVRVDTGQIAQVIMNLVINARDAMPRGGTLTIETRNETIDAPFVAMHPGLKPGPYVLLAVRDTGCGMNEETIKRIFEPFFTTKPPGKGTGFGLAIVFGIIKQSGGDVWVYSEPGVGTTFKVFLPRVDVGAGSPDGAPTPGDVPEGTETILVAEDEETVRVLTCKLLQECGYTVLVAEGGQQALDLAAGYAERIDLLVTDVVMPDVNGARLAQALQASRPSLKVLYLSGHTSDVIAHHGVLNDGVQFLEKPFSLEALARRIRGILDSPEPTAV